MEVSIWGWVWFMVFVIAMLAIDLGVFNRKAHVVRFREALSWSIVWIAMALLFNVGVYVYGGKQAGHEFLAGYLIEKSLSVDNIFVFVLIFSYFRVHPMYQHRILFWGIVGALVFRGIMIAAGVALINRFEWILYIFGVFLIFTGIRMAFHKDDEMDVAKNPILRFARRVLPVANEDHGSSFFIREAGRVCVTPLFLVLIVVETTDIVFAVDSIPAIFAVTHDPFIIFTSNVFAILGLRALYFVLAGVIELFRFLKLGLSAILVFVGVKMLLGHTAYKIPTPAALGVIAAFLAISIAASMFATYQEKKKAARISPGE